MMRNHTYHECSNCFPLYPDVEVAKMATVPYDEKMIVIHLPFVFPVQFSFKGGTHVFSKLAAKPKNPGGPDYAAGIDIALRD